MEHKLDITIQARYFSHGKPTAPNLVVALHGYGQLGSYFIRKFEGLDPDNYYVVVPEGLHRFYLSGTEGRVGASWMTKENRETDIQNYINYLNQVMTAVCKHHVFSKKILLGFSQGGATASRFMAFGNEAFDVFLLWAAVFPPDMPIQKSASFRQSRNFLVVGNNDPYYKQEDFVMEQNKLTHSGMTFELVTFNGNHTVDTITLEQLVNEI